jgi:excinuclease ABC subunit A
MMHIDPDMIVQDDSLSLNEGAIRVGGWNFDDRTSWARAYAEAMSDLYGFSLDTPFRDLPKKIQKMFLMGNGGEVLTLDTSNSRFSHGGTYRSSYEGVVPSLERRYAETGSDDMKEYYEQFMSVRVCPSCQGARLKPESLAVTVGRKNIYELTCLPIRKRRNFWTT